MLCRETVGDKYEQRWVQGDSQEEAREGAPPDICFQALLGSPAYIIAFVPQSERANPITTALLCGTLRPVATASPRSNCQMPVLGAVSVEEHLCSMSTNLRQKMRGSPLVKMYEKSYEHLTCKELSAASYDPLPQ
jgi:hypothetical protein